MIAFSKTWRAGWLLGSLSVLLLFPVSRIEAAPHDLSAYEQQVDTSIDKALVWLAQQQFDLAKARQLGAPGLVGSIAERKPGNTGITSLCVLAFLSKGHTPGLGPYGETINRGIDYVMNQQQADGLLVSKHEPGRTHGVMYSHAISTLMLAETSGMVDAARQEKLDTVLAKALAVILKAQNVKKVPNHAGGWRYQPNSTDSDLSLTGWCIMALRAAKLNGAPVPTENIDRAIEYVLRTRHPQQNGFAYHPGGAPNIGLTAAGVLCLELCGQHGHEAIAPAAEFIRRQQPKQYDPSMNACYARYYYGQAAFQLGPQFWADFAPQMFKNVVEAQLPGGEWPPADGACGSCYSTAMNVLAMTPAYRQLPIYQRDQSYDEDDFSPDVE